MRGTAAKHCFTLLNTEDIEITHKKSVPMKTRCIPEMGDFLMLILLFILTMFLLASLPPLISCLFMRTGVAKL